MVAMRAEADSRARFPDHADDTQGEHKAGLSGGTDQHTRLAGNIRHIRLPSHQVRQRSGRVEAADYAAHHVFATRPQTSAIT